MMKTLKPNTILKREARIEIQLGPASRVRVAAHGNSAFYLEHSLTILDVFARPTSVREAVAILNARGHQDWIDLTGTINRLYRAGVLVEPGNEFTPDARVNSFGAPPVHISMLNDRVRTEGYLQAIAEVVKPGDVVVDIGTGTGILAVAAARAGAARVYAIEAGAMADAAQAVFQATDLVERLILVRGWSTKIDLPERADVMVSEIIGRDPFEERVLQTTIDARRRLLKPEARLVPHKIRAYALAVTIPSDELARISFTNKTVENWQAWYGVDFAPLVTSVRDSASPALRMASRVAATWPMLSDPMPLVEVNLKSFRDTSIEKTVHGAISAGGVMNGLLMFFEIDIGSKMITTHPLKSAPESSWVNPVWSFRDARPVRTGDQLTIHYDYNTAGNNSEIKLA